MTPMPVAVIPDDLIPEILSSLPVNSLLRFRCVSNYWKTLISDPAFVKLHLKKSKTRNPLFTLITNHGYGYSYSVVPYSLHRLIENPPFTLSVDPYYHLRNKECSRIVGTCNGLILLYGGSFETESIIKYFRLWNPATRTISPTFGHYSNFLRNPRDRSIVFLGGCYRFTFCCDDSTDTYKIVASSVRFGRLDTRVRILILGHNVWRDIESVPVVPLHMEIDDGNFAVYFCSTLNWLAINSNRYDLNDEQFIIISLDLGTETFNQYRLPGCFDEMPPVPPIVSVLGGFLCFSYFYKETDFVIWQMKEFGVEDSWTQFLKISLQDLQIDYDYSRPSVYEGSFVRFQLIPVLIFEDVDTLDSKERETIINNIALSILGYSHLPHEVQSCEIKLPHLLDVVHSFVNINNIVNNNKNNPERVVDIRNSTQTQNAKANTKLKLKCCATRLQVAGDDVKLLKEKNVIVDHMRMSNHELEPGGVYPLNDVRS